MLGICAAGCTNTVTISRLDGVRAEIKGGPTVSADYISGPNSARVVRALKKAVNNHPRLVWSEDKPMLICSGQVTVQVDEKKGIDLVQGRKNTGQEEQVTIHDRFVDQNFTLTRPQSVTIAEPFPFVMRRAVLTLQYTVRNSSGAIEQKGVVKAQSELKYGGFNEQAETGLTLSDLPSPEKTLDSLSVDLADKLISRLQTAVAGHWVLDKGLGLFGEPEVRRGVDLAGLGRWEEAVTVWQEVLVKDPENPAANYNLGVAKERLGGQKNLEAARSRYSQAAKIGSKPIYRQALTRVSAALQDLGPGRRTPAPAADNYQDWGNILSGRQK